MDASAHHALYWAAWAVPLAAMALFSPNTQQMLSWGEMHQHLPFQWKPTLAWALVTGCLFGISIAGIMTKPTTFLYFRF